MARLRAALTVVTLLAGCATGESTDFLTVANNTRDALVVFAFPDGTLIDPIPYLPPGSYHANMILARHRLGFDHVEGYQPGKGVFLFIYVVQRQGAYLATTRNVSGMELRVRRGLVPINSIPPCPITEFCTTQEGRPAP